MDIQRYTDNCDSYFQPEYSMIADIEGYIFSELKDSIYYIGLSKRAPAQQASDLLIELADDEKKHAEEFIKAYGRLTGMAYRIPAIEELHIQDYNEALRARLLEETNDYKKYGIQYLRARNQWLKELFFSASLVEAQHAMKILFLVQEK